MKTATIDEYTPYGTRHYGITATYRGKAVAYDVVHPSQKDEAKNRILDVLKREHFTHWKRPNSNIKQIIV